MKKNADNDSDQERKKFVKEDMRQRRYEKMIVLAKEKRDIWIGHKLGNVVTDVKIGGKKSLNEALLIQHSKLNNNYLLMNTSLTDSVSSFCDRCARG